MITVAKDSWLLFGKPDSKTEEYCSEIGLQPPFQLQFDFITRSSEHFPECLPDFLNVHPSDERQKTEELMQSHPSGLLRRHLRRLGERDYALARPTKKGCCGSYL